MALKTFSHQNLLSKYHKLKQWHVISDCHLINLRWRFWMATDVRPRTRHWRLHQYKQRLPKWTGNRLHTCNWTIHTRCTGKPYTTCLGFPYTYKYKMITENILSNNKISLCSSFFKMNNLTSPAAQIILNFATCVKPVYHERWRSCSIRYLFDSDCSNVTQMGQLFISYYGSSIMIFSLISHHLCMELALVMCSILKQSWSVWYVTSFLTLSFILISWPSGLGFLCYM